MIQLASAREDDDPESKGEEAVKQRLSVVLQWAASYRTLLASVRPITGAQAPPIGPPARLQALQAVQARKFKVRMLSSTDRMSTVLGEIGPYRVIRPLGQGGMGTVLLAEDSRLVALKTFSGPEARSLHAREHLLSEARAAAALSHPEGLRHLLVRSAA
jgi:hypothetical protein